VGFFVGLFDKRSKMEELTNYELIEISGGNPRPMNWWHKVGDFVQEVVLEYFCSDSFFVMKE